eukprot:scaffold12023_cov67-Phaeocystis_antarctica.AAC.2
MENHLGLNVCIRRVSERTLVEQRAQIDQVVRVEVGGATGLAFDEIAQRLPLHSSQLCDGGWDKRPRAMKASRSAAAALAAFCVDWYAWHTARTEATITENSKVNIRATESTAASNVYKAWSSSDRRSESLTSSESTPILSTRLKNKTITREKQQSKLNLSWPRLWNGSAIDVKRRITSENAKPMMSCTVEPGRMSTQTPTRNSCGAQRWAVRCGQLARNGCEHGAA